MRHFYSYGPVDCEDHFCVPRRPLVARCLEQLIGVPERGGHYFTIWAPRQTGKTWLLRQMKREIPQRCPDQFAVYHFSLGNLRGLNWSPKDESDKIRLPQAFRDVLETELPGCPIVKDWKQFDDLFSKEKGLWDRPLILMIDEVDTAPPALLDLLAGRLRELYLSRYETNLLHGLALIGVRAVLGVDSLSGSPFNIQKSLHVPNFTEAEVTDLFNQYQQESGQSVASEVVELVYENTNGQPGLVCWFGELLTETYNPGFDQPIDMETWKIVWLKARVKEPNNTVMNLIAKARIPEYRDFLLTLFAEAEIPFSFHNPLHNFLYMHGILESDITRTPDGEPIEVCRFSSPFVQRCLYDALSIDILQQPVSVLPLDPFDELTGVFAGDTLDLPALLRRYVDYLARLKTRKIEPWKEQPRRTTDLHLTEAVGHFHLYAWLKDAVGGQCIVSPEFPTGNGKVDLHLRCGKKHGIIEVKSFRNAFWLKHDKQTAAAYAKQLGLASLTMAVFVPVADESVLEKLSGTDDIDGVCVQVIAIGWG